VYPIHGIADGIFIMEDGEIIPLELKGGAISGASDLNETLSKSQTIFGANAGAIESWASGAAQAAGLSKAAALEAAAGFGNMFTQIGFGAEEAARLSQSTVQMAADLGSFNNVPTADVANRISAAFRGEYDSLQTLIPNINAARVEQEAMAATGKTNARELTAQEKAAAVLAIVNKDGAAAMGDFAKTADGAANTQKTLTASLEDQQSKLGQTLMPLWQDFLGFLTDTAVPALSAIVDWISQNASWLGPLSAALGIATGAVWLFNIALNANPIMLIITAIGALVGGILYLATQTTFFQDVWTNVTNAIGAAWNWLWTSVLQPVFTAIGDVFSWIYNNIIMPVVTGIMLYIGLWAAVITWLWQSVISPVFAAIGQVFNWIWGSVISPVVGFISAGIQAAGAVFSWLYASAIKPAFDGVAGAFNWVWGSIISPVANAISGAINNVGNTVRDVFGGIGSFIGSAFQAALNVVRGPINGIISLVNSAIRGLNSLSVTIPSWVPIVGGQTWGLNLPTIPMLAKGGTITGAGSVLVGENGPEILNVGRGASVVPLTGSQRTPVDGGEKHFHLEQKIYATDPILGARQAAREAARYLGV
ncbi:phage tail protein, partial [Parasutterella excrementihominis]|uniref:phage tail protein n=1 Tax=Parasutterella excrementihominis TaxID=487175 RepID=UPI003F6CB0E6